MAPATHHTVKRIIFPIYILFFLSLAAWFHKDVLFNLHNYGRHWDWTFYAISDFYRNYLQQSLSAIKPNSLGYVDILSVNIGEFGLKALIYGVFSLLIHIPGMWVSIPVLNKIAVFILLPMLTSLGIWTLARSALKTTYREHPWFFLGVASLANIVYTFSLVLIFDLHGGALNRQISSMLFPWFFYFIFTYLDTPTVQRIDYRIVGVSLCFMAFDISDIFYAGIVAMGAVLAKRIPWPTKLIHVILLGAIVIGINSYWIQGIIIGDTVDTGAIAQERKQDYNILAGYSVPYRYILSMNSTPHDLGNRTFSHNVLIYLPFLSLYVIMLVLLAHFPLFRQRKRLALFLVSTYLFTTILASGVYGVGRIYELLYSINYFAFIRAAVRYLPNLAAFTIFTFLIILRLHMDRAKHPSRLIWTLITIPFTLWFLFLATNGNMISLVYDRVVRAGPISVNHEIGALYDYNPSAQEKVRNERLVYNILPIPSWFSNIFQDNVYPRTSQGSDMDNFYLDKGLLQTYGLETFSSAYLGLFINSHPSDKALGLLNTRSMLFRNQTPVQELTTNLYFHNAWALQSTADTASMKTAMATHGLFELPIETFLPQVYVPTHTLITDKPISYLPNLIANQEDVRSAVLFTSQNQGVIPVNGDIREELDTPPVVEFKKINFTSYRAIVHGVRSDYHLVVSVPYHSGWTARLIPHQKSKEDSMSSYRIQPGNENTQATSDEVASYIAKGLISQVHGTGRTVSRIIYSEGGEKLAGTDRYPIDFISHMYQGTIQNDNLKDIEIGDRWSTEGVSIPTQNHYQVNGYANDWKISSSLCIGSDLCTENADGSRDMEFLIMFKPQRTYQAGLIASGTIIALAVFAALYQLRAWRRRHI